MSRAAVPAYVGDEFGQTPPGHRFGLYFPCWEPVSWKRQDTARRIALQECTKLSEADIASIDALLMRQQALAAQAGQTIFSYPACSTAPFVTGLGMEHPSENGFAFLNPYGLPYLPGAAVKGALRTAAERLALGLDGQEPAGWDMLAVWLLFGFDASSPSLASPPRDGVDLVVDEAAWWRQQYLEWVHSGGWDETTACELIKRLGLAKGWLEQPQAFLEGLANGFPSGTNVNLADLALAGALNFWDVIIRPPANRLDVEILTPHYMHYYQQGEPPHESGRLTPNPFMVVPPDSAFLFFVHCPNKRLPQALQSGWKTLLGAAFDESLEWAGVGAKTATGYGILQHDAALADKAREAILQQEESSRRAQMTPEQLAIEQVAERLEKEQTAHANSGPGGELAMLRNRLLDDAQGWEDSDRRHQAAEIIAKTVQWIPWPKKKKTERNQSIDRLRKS